MTEAIRATRKFLTTHYKEYAEGLAVEYPDEPNPYSKEHWEESTLEWLCRELHQILYDEGAHGVMALAQYFIKLEELEGHEEVIEMFWKTEEHSH